MNLEICKDPFFGRYLVCEAGTGKIIEGFDTLEEAQTHYPDAPIGADYDDPG